MTQAGRQPPPPPGGGGVGQGRRRTKKRAWTCVRPFDGLRQGLAWNVDSVVSGLWGLAGPVGSQNVLPARDGKSSPRAPRASGFVTCALETEVRRRENSESRRDEGEGGTVERSRPSDPLRPLVRLRLGENAG